jgi:hypothetical protein
MEIPRRSTVKDKPSGGVAAGRRSEMPAAICRGVAYSSWWSNQYRSSDFAILDAKTPQRFRTAGSGVYAASCITLPASRSNSILRSVWGTLRA